MTYTLMLWLLLWCFLKTVFLVHLVLVGPYLAYPTCLGLRLLSCQAIVGGEHSLNRHYETVPDNLLGWAYLVVEYKYELNYNHQTLI